MAYLTEDEFDSLGGDSGTVTAFPMYAAKAERLIDRLTHDRLLGETPVRKSVQYCMVELIKAMNEADQHGGREVASVSNDGVSVSYAAAGSANSGGTDPRYLRIVRDWLGGEVSQKGVPLLYAGVDA